MLTNHKSWPTEVCYNWIRLLRAYLFITVWSNISPSIHLFLIKENRRCQAQEMRKEISPILKAFDMDIHGVLGTLEAADIMPRPIDIYFLPKVKKCLVRLHVMRGTDIRYYTKEISTFPCYQKLLAALPALIRQWQSNTRATFREAMIPGVTNSDGVFDLARTCFHCSLCRRVLFYPGVMSHDCMYREHFDPHAAQSEDVFNDALKYDAQIRGEGPWNVHYVKLDEKICRQMDKIITTCKKKPKSTTRTEMDSLTTRLVCLNCKVPHEYQEVMTWRRAVCGLF